MLLYCLHEWLCKLCYSWCFETQTPASCLQHWHDSKCFKKRKRNSADIKGSIPSYLIRARGTWITDLKAQSKALHLMDIMGTIFCKISFSLLNHWMIWFYCLPDNFTNGLLLFFFFPLFKENYQIIYLFCGFFSLNNA